MSDIKLQCGSKVLDLSTPRVMAILNTTPDSFSDGGKLYYGNKLSMDLVLHKARQMTEAGADIIDIGGESTRPGAEAVSLQEEMDRVVPVVESIRANLDVVISVDTSTPELITEAARLGAGFINDTRALRRPGALEAAAESGLPVCLMHMQGEPKNMQKRPRYGNIAKEVEQFLQERIEACEEAGIETGRIVVDPGFGFGKSLEHNLQLFANLHQLCNRRNAVLVGLSRKSMLQALTGRAVDDRLAGSLALALMAVQQGVHIIRVHDVAETVDVLKLHEVLKQRSN